MVDDQTAMAAVQMVKVVAGHTGKVAVRTVRVVDQMVVAGVDQVVAAEVGRKFVVETVIAATLGTAEPQESGQRVVFDSGTGKIGVAGIVHPPCQQTGLAHQSPPDINMTV
jgi:hypothetical protein